MSSPTDEEIVEDIRRVAQRFGGTQIGRADYRQHGRYSEYQIYDGGRTWTQMCKLAGLETKAQGPVADDVYFENLSHAYAALGRLPKASERKAYGLNFSKRRWPNLLSFYRQAANAGVIPNEAVGVDDDPFPEERRPGSDEHADFVVAASSADRPVPPIPASTKRRKWARTGLDGFPYAPQDESGTVAVFAILCACRAINWQIVELNGGKGIDAKCYDHDSGREINVEIKSLLSRTSWNHHFDEIDAVVCWENRWRDFPKRVIELKSVLNERRSKVSLT